MYKHIVLGLGKTGLSVARFLRTQNIDCVVFDSRTNPPALQELQNELPDVRIICGDFEKKIFENAEVLYVSPGISLNEPAILSACKKGVKISGDIDLFSQHAKAPIVAITGTNGKSTVTTLVGEMAKCADKKVACGGNLGTPILDLLHSDIELYVVEVSSFQLETTPDLGAQVATCLNIAPDHQDRYANLDDYINAKKRITNGAECVVVNGDYPQFASDSARTITFGMQANYDFCLLTVDDQIYLARQGKPLINVNELKIVGKHNWLNALAALALGYGAGLEFAPMLSALRNFAGLEHRCQFVRNLRGVNYYNDSKATNVASCTAALESIGEGLVNGTIKPATDEYLQEVYLERIKDTFPTKTTIELSFVDFCKEEVTNKVVLILGGESKNADFSDLIPSINKYCSAVFYIGRDGHKISEQIKNHLNRDIEQINASDFKAWFKSADPKEYKTGDDGKCNFSKKHNEYEHINNLEVVRTEAFGCLMKFLRKILKTGNAVLFAPACASFDQFANFEERGSFFVKRVMEIE